MSGKERGVFQLIWKSFFASIKPNFTRSKLMGEDFYGTKYYEVPAASYSSRKKPSRYFVPVNKDNHEQELPAEWEAWLRYRRAEPPAKEEVEENYRIANQKKENAARIEAMYSNMKLNKPEVLPEKKGQQSFPTYDEYGKDGQDYKIKRPW